MAVRFFLRSPGFELGDTGWTKSGAATIVSEGANARSGLWVAKSSAASAEWRQRGFAVRPGSKVSSSAWIKQTADHDGSPGAGVEWLDKDGAEISQVVDTVPAGGTSYAQASLVDAVAPDRAKEAQIVIFSGNTTVGTVWLDDVDAFGDIIETIPATAKIEEHKFLPSRTIASFDPLVGTQKFSDFNAGMSDKWTGTYTFMPLHPDGDSAEGDLGELLAFLERLGRTERFFAYDPDRLVPKNGVVNGMVVDGASQTGTLIAVRGGPVNTTALVKGDYMEVADQYYQLLRNLEIGPEGTGSAHVWPAIRTSPADGEEIITDHPAMVARITSDIPRASDHTKWTGITVSWEEV